MNLAQKSQSCPWCFPFLSILIFQNKQTKNQALTKGHFYLKPGGSGRNESSRPVVRVSHLAPGGRAQITESREPVPFPPAKTEPASSHLGTQGRASEEASWRARRTLISGGPS